jgi:transcriptional regulator with XRE-family HTH domain
MKLGRAMKLMRTASGLKQKEVAAKLKVTQNYLSLLENGKRDPSLAFLKELSRVLGVPIGLFFLWEEVETRPSQRSLDQVRTLLARLEAMYLFAKRGKARRQIAA